MTVSALQFAWQGVSVRVRARGAEAIRAVGRLAEDFENFTEDPVAPHTVLEFHLTSPRASAKPLGRALFRAANCRVFGFGGLGARRDCEYTDGTLLLSRRSGELHRFEIFGDRTDGIHETSYEAILSAMGEAHDRRGLHRVHALGLESRGKAGLLILPSGGGKSTLAALIARENRCRILSEETPLVTRQGFLLPFPLRVAVSPEIAARYFQGRKGRPFPRRLFPLTKLLFSLEREMTGEPAKPAFLLIGTRVRAAEASITPASKFATFRELFVSLVVGYGVAQMKEHLLRLSNLPALVAIAYSRLVTAVHLARTTPAYRLTCSPNPELTLQALEAFLALEGLTGTDIMPLRPNYGDEHPQPLHARTNLPQAVASPDRGEPQIALPSDDRGLPLGGPQSSDSVWRPEHPL